MPLSVEEDDDESHYHELPLGQLVHNLHEYTGEKRNLRSLIRSLSVESTEADGTVKEINVNQLQTRYKVRWYQFILHLPRWRQKMSHEISFQAHFILITADGDIFLHILHVFLYASLD